jgi:hypothetical protein
MDFRIVVTLLLLISSYVSADQVALPVDATGIVVDRPLCFAENSTVEYFYATDAMLVRNNAVTAMAAPDPTSGKPAIFISFREFQTFSPEFQMWVLSHECAHWELGHIRRSYTSSAAIEYEENAADCRAAHSLVAMGFSDDQLNKVLDEIVKVEERRWQFAPAPPIGVDKRKSKAEFRSQNALTCMMEARQHYGK